MMKILIVFSIFPYLFITFVYSQEQNIKMITAHLDFSHFEDQQEAFSPKIITEKVGNDVQLKCKDHDKASNVHVHQWKFAYCNDCDETDPSDLKWQDLSQQKKKLHLKNLTTSDSGRYICIVQDTIIASYQLKVPNPRNFIFAPGDIKFIGRPPEIIDIEQNDDNVAVKCKVFSPLVPRIWWLKQCEPAEKCDFNYNGNYYHKINVTYQDILLNSDENIYVSKLRLSNFTQFDNGMYVCVALTALGKDYRNFTLKLPPTRDGYTDEGKRSSLNFLFLVPFIFILVPICIDCIGKRIGVEKSKQEVVLLEVIQPSTSRVYHC